MLAKIDDTLNIVSLTDLVCLQKSDGHWELDSEFHEITLNDAIKIPCEVSEELKSLSELESVLATIFAICKLKSSFIDSKATWILICTKAKAWL